MHFGECDSWVKKTLSIRGDLDCYNKPSPNIEEVFLNNNFQELGFA